MRTVTATEASRRFSDLLDAIEAGDTVTVTRGNRLIAHARRSGRARGAHDLIIAAHAAQTERTLLSSDALARFSDLPGVTAEQP